MKHNKENYSKEEKILKICYVAFLICSILWLITAGIDIALLFIT